MLFDFENTVTIDEDNSDPQLVQDLPVYKYFDPKELPWKENGPKIDPNAQQGQNVAQS